MCPGCVYAAIRLTGYNPQRVPMPNFLPSPQNQIVPRIHRTDIEGVYFIAHQIHQDDRGFFAEIALLPDLNAVRKSSFTIKQINLARSAQNVARGFHYEDWHKFITILHGQAFCALVDIRPQSPSFLKTVTCILGESTDALTGSLFIPTGVANSYCVTQGPVDYLYGVDKLYRDRTPSDNGAISLFDPDLAIDWPLPQDRMIISERDQNARTLRQKFPEVRF